MQNLDLTYAVRDGIISHCGEIDENCVRPRTEYIDLHDYNYPNQYAPYTWEGCVVKISDKISCPVKFCSSAPFLSVILKFNGNRSNYRIFFDVHIKLKFFASCTIKSSLFF